MKAARVQVRRERPTAAAWAVALAVTMLFVYVLTLGAARPVAVARVSAESRATREINLKALKMYCVSLGGWPDAGQARIEAAGYVSRGAAGFVQEIDGVWHVLGALYALERDAKRAAKRLTERGDAQADALCVEAKAVTLRVTAPAHQIDAISAADEAMRAQIGQLGDLSLQLDRGQIAPEAARALCAVAATQTHDAASALEATPTAAENALCAALAADLRALSEQLDDISKSAQAAPAALSGMLRLAQIDAFMRLRALQSGLASGG